MAHIMTQKTKGILLSFFYILTRIGHFSRELTYEEGVVWMPGRFFFEGKGYHLNWGEHHSKLIDPDANPFHKPELSSLLLGAFSMLTPDGVIGARFAPFMISFLVCMVPFWITGSAIPSIIVIFSPFLYAAASQMQTDPIAGLLGYTLISMGVVIWWKDRKNKHLGWILGGLIALWIGKLELAIASTGSLFIATFLIEKGKDQKTFFKNLAIGLSAGILSFILLTWSLGAIQGFSFRQSVLWVIEVMNSFSHKQSTVQSLDTPGRNALISNMTRYWGWHTLFFLYGASFFLYVTSAKKRKFTSEFRLLVILLGVSIAPVLGYLFGSWPGDPFPRYFLSAFPPALLMLGVAFKFFDENAKKSKLKYVVYLYAIFYLPTYYMHTRDLVNTRGSVTSHIGYLGSEMAGRLVQSLTNPGDLVVLYEPQVLYVKDRRLFTIDSFLAANEYTAKVEAKKNEVKAMVIGKLPKDPKIRYAGVLGSVLRTMESRPHLTIPLENYDVIVLKD